VVFKVDILVGVCVCTIGTYR